MNIKELKASLPYLFKAELTAFIWGHSGLGKSTVIKQYADELGYKFFAFFLGTMSDTGDILGLAEFVRNSEGRAVSTAFAMPEWLETTIRYCNENPNSGAIIFLDEFNLGRKDLMNASFSLALDKMFHTIKLPKNCHLIAAGNPDTDEYQVTNMGSNALLSRFVHIKLEPTFQEWKDYAEVSKIEASMVGFLQEQPNLLEDVGSEFQLPVKVNRRSWSRLNKLTDVNTPTDLWHQLAKGIIGVERLEAYKAFLTQTEKPLAADEVFAGKRLHQVQAWSSSDNVKSSMISVSCDNVFDSITKHPELLTEQAFDNLLAYVKVIPKDMTYAFLRRLQLANVKAFQEGFIKNPKYVNDLVALVKDARGDRDTKVA